MAEEVEVACGQDVHKDNVMTTVYKRKVKEPLLHERFERTVPSLLRLRERLKELHVEVVAMESTGPYWMLIYAVLHEDFKVIVGNSARMKNHDGKKTDKRDSKWIAKLALNGEIEPSHIPPGEFLELRRLTRGLRNMVEMSSTLKNRLKQELELAGVRLFECVKSFGASAEKFLRLLGEGKTVRESIDAIQVQKTREKLASGLSDVECKLSQTSMVLVRSLLATIEVTEKQIVSLEFEIERALRPYEKTLDSLTSIPGVGPRLAQVALCEVGDFTAFPTNREFASWCGIVPTVYESNGKRFYGRLQHGNKYIKGLAVQCAWRAVSTKKDNAFKQYFNHLVNARKKQKTVAICAVAHKMVKVMHTLVVKGIQYFQSEHKPKPINRKKQPPGPIEDKLGLYASACKALA